MKIIIQLLSLLSLSFLGLLQCKSPVNETDKFTKIVPVNFSVTAEAESDPVPGITGQDAADDPAIWYNEHNPAESLVFGTDKKGGIMVFNLEGKAIKYHKIGLPNNIDIRNGFRFAGEKIDIAGFSNRESNTLEIFRIDPEGDITRLNGSTIKPAFTGEVYGFCLYHDRKSDRFFAFVNSKEGDLEQWSLDGKQGYLKARLVNSFKFGSQLEGMVADDENGILFIGEEDTGIWSLKIQKRKKYSPVLLPEGSISNNQALKADIEGLALSYSVSGGYLVASIQGNNSYAIFNRYPPHKYIGSFVISGSDFDGAEETDGIDICNLPLNKTYPSGIFVVQDGINVENYSDTIPQNFKFVSWSTIVRTIHNAVLVQVQK